jgi:GTPase involved in cell partitioning and DNA repair
MSSENHNLMHQIKALEEENETLKNMLSDRNSIIVAVRVDGISIEVLGVFDSSSNSSKIVENLEEKLNENSQTESRTVNWIISKPILINHVERF